MQFKSISDFRNAVRAGNYRGHTSGIFTGNAQFNVVILDKAYAPEFRDFCNLNPVPCPLVFESSPGQTTLSEIGEVDIRTDIPVYCVYKEGKLEQEVSDIFRYWSDDWVTFLLGCSFTFEFSLMNAGIPLRHVEQEKNVAMYRTNLPLNTTEHFLGNMVVSMRWIKRDQLDKVVEVTSRYPNFHGAPVYIGDADKIGIRDINHPDYGEAVGKEDDEVSVFWGCGVTPQNCILNNRLPMVITHKPGSMLISDLTNQQVLDMTNQQSKSKK